LSGDADADAFAQGAMFMTEQDARSDVGATVTIARRDGNGNGGVW
jgi:alkylation response protein AidB-like acyl-CoA dehydrogenase